jgi:hypothetical protein
MDLSYEELVKDPVAVLKKTCAFLGEQFAPEMLEFHRTELARNRGATKDHKPLGHETSDRYIGIYKRQLSLRDQEIFAAVAGRELEEAGYKSDVRAAHLSEEQIALWRELDGRIRAATMDAPEGHIVYESYNDWLVDQREERKRRGLWKDSDTPREQFPLGHRHEEMIMGQRAWRYWKDYLCIKRRYVGKTAL